MIRLRAFLASMTGRVFVILLVGMIAAALVAAEVTRRVNNRKFEQELREFAAYSLQLYIDFLEAAPREMRPSLLAGAGFGIHNRPESVRGNEVDTQFQQMLAARGGPLSKATVQTADLDVCFSEYGLAKKDYVRFNEEVKRMVERFSADRNLPVRQATSRTLPPVCYLVATTLRDGTKLRLAFKSPFTQRESSSFLEPSFLALLTLSTAILAYVVARFAGAPLNRLSAAAVRLGQDLDRAPMHVSGPTEVQHAAAAFNAMQKRLQQHVSERTRMLASITHDLQTPSTRLRLRLERVEDEGLRERLLADLAAMQALIEEGLELARSAETSEPRVMLDLDSLLESLVEDLIDAGGQAVFEQRCYAVLPLRPLAVRRLFSNLIDNAIKYGGSARVSATHAGGKLIVRVRDRGPGLPDDMLERVFDPFVRIDASRSRQTGGAGLGLTIARMLAEKNGARLILRNHPDGGLEAITQWDEVGEPVGPRA